MHLTVAYRAGYEALTQGIDGFKADPVESHRGCKYRRIVFPPRIELRNGRHQASEGNASAIVANGTGGVVRNVHLDALTEAFVKFVDRIVDGFLE